MLLDRSCDTSVGGAFAALRRIPVFHGASRRDVRIECLSNSFTNSSFRVDFAGESFLLRLPGAGTLGFVDRKSEEHNARIAARRGVNAEILFFDASDGTMVCRFIEGEGMDAESFASDHAAPARAAATLRRVHRCGERFASRFDPFERIGAYARILRRSRVPLPDDLPLVLEAMNRTGRRLGPPAPLAPCHNDPWPGNFVDAGTRMYLIDWEYSGMNDPMWDLADLSVEADFDAAKDEILFETYFEGSVPGDSRRRFETYKPVSDFLWALWGFFQMVNGNSKPAPGEDFFAYAVGRHERCKIRLFEPAALLGASKFPVV
jgi:thiamine kinase-like enzyme